METIVLPAHDHLAQERYMQQSRSMGLVYNLGGFTRTRRKLRPPPPQSFGAAVSMHSVIAKASSGKNGHVSDMASPIDMSFGILRSAAAPQSSGLNTQLHYHHPTSASSASLLKTPQYRLNHVKSTGFISHESSQSKQQQQQQQQPAASMQSAQPVSNGVPAGQRHQILRNRSDGEFFQQAGGRKGAEGEKQQPFERRRANEKNFDSAKSSSLADRKVLDRNPVRKASERRTVEKKASSPPPVEKLSNVPKKAGVITILQRPQTKEAAAENIALFTGRPIEDVTKQMQKKSATVAPRKPKPPTAVMEIGPVPALLDSPAVLDEGVPVLQDLPPRPTGNGSPNKPAKTRKTKPVSRSADIPAQGATRMPGAEFYTESRKPRFMPLPVAKFAYSTSSSSDLDSASEDIDSDGLEAIVNDLEKFVKEEDEKSNDSDRKGNTSPVPVSPKSPVSPLSLSGTIPSSEVRKWYDISLTGALVRGSSDPLIRDVVPESVSTSAGVSRSGSFKDVSRDFDNGLELLYLGSSPSKPSERWAGPAYTNSPPPSTLPFPSFQVQRMKTSLTEVSMTDVSTTAEVVLSGPQDTTLESRSNSAPESPARMSPLFFAATATSTQSSFVDPTSATKDLKRMLNLDFEGGLKFGLTMEDGYNFTESATQSLKRILQLG